MATARPCDFCGTAYIAKNSRSRFCSDRCRADNGGKGAKSVAVSTQTGTTDATEAALSAVDRLSDPNGQAALVLARRIDQNTDNGSGMASLVRELRATLQAALANASGVADPVDQLRTMRDAKRRRAAG